jgi:hypothetical protein
VTGDLPGRAGPLALSLLVPVYRTPLDYLTEMVGSVQAQTDPRWQLILLDDGSGEAEPIGDGPGFFDLLGAPFALCQILRVWLPLLPYIRTCPSRRSDRYRCSD